MVMFRWISRLVAWLVLEWATGVLGIIFVLLGILPSDVEGGAMIQFLQEMLGSNLARYSLVALGLAFIFGSVYQNFFSYAALRSELRAALDDLNSDNIHVRMHAVEEILSVSRKSRHLHQRAMRVLSNFVRTRAPAPALPGRTTTVNRQRLGRPTAAFTHNRDPDIHKFAQSEISVPRRDTPSDIKAAVEVIAQRRKFFDDPRQWVDLSETDLPSISLEGLKIGQVSFAGAYLRHARFDGSDLRGAGFDCAILTDATFDNADLRNSKFFGCLGHRIHMDGADLRGAEFFGADLYDACIQKADARKASFFGANLWRLDGGLTDFAGADFFQANLTGASLHHAKGLRREQILGEHGNGAIVDKSTRLPWSAEDELRAAGVFRANPPPKPVRSWHQWLLDIVRRKQR